LIKLTEGLAVGCKGEGKLEEGLQLLVSAPGSNYQDGEDHRKKKVLFNVQTDEENYEDLLNWSCCNLIKLRYQLGNWTYIFRVKKNYLAQGERYFSKSHFIFINFSFFLYNKWE
jgi:hypothetical protein